LLTTTLCGPFAINFAGTIGHVFLTFIGFMFFDDAKLTNAVLIGLCCSFVGAIHFSYYKYIEIYYPEKTDDEKKSK
jgi:hypothetical protein